MAIKKLIQVSRTGDEILGRWKQLWGRAGVEKVAIFEQWEDVEVISEKGKGKFGVEGFFSLTASHSKASQFICKSDGAFSAHKDILFNAGNIQI